MPTSPSRLPLHLPSQLHGQAGAALAAGFAALRTELNAPEAFPPEVVEAAVRASAQPLPDYPDRTDIPFLTIDPPASMDLDQALHLARSGTGYVLTYAIADVGAFVRPGDPLDVEARKRGQTLYAPDGRIPLHPAEASEGAASLLPDAVRPAAVWEIEVDEAGELGRVDVRRALVRSQRRLDYTAVQSQLDAGTDDEALLLLREVGLKLQEAERRRGGIDLPIPEQEIIEQNGGYRLELRMRIPAEGWNAQLSLLTGRAAARLMLEGGVGVLRTLPETPAAGIAQLKRAAGVLGVDWPRGASYADVIRTVTPDADPEHPLHSRHSAFVQQATRLLRGSGYTAFTDGQLPEHPEHAGVGAPYAHVTAPLRRLVDRFGTEVCLALCAGELVPAEILGALPDLPGRMAETDRRANALERASIDLIEAALLEPHVGAVYEGAVVDARQGHATVQLADPPVRASVDGDLPLGERVQVRLAEVSVTDRKARFEPADEQPGEAEVSP